MLLAGPAALAGTKAGNPWHGTWTEAGLELSNTDVIELDSPPEGDAASCPTWTISDSDRGRIWPSFGDCFLFRVPDLAAVTTSEAEENKGMKWLNYALFCGTTHVLYGIPIGIETWVYLDSNRTPWLAKMLSQYCNDGVYRPSIRFSRNFEFSGEEEIHTVVVSESDGNLNAQSFFVTDCSSTGRCLTYSFYSVSLGFIYPGVETIVLSGVPGVDLAASIVATTIDSDITLVGDYIGAGYNAGGRWYELSNNVVGNIFDGDTKVSVSVGLDLEFPEKTPIYGVFPPSTITGNLLITCGHGSIEIPVEQTITWNSFGELSESTTSVSGYEFTASGYASSAQFFGIPVLEVWRRSNKVIEIVLVSDIDGNPFGFDERHSVCLVLPDRFEMTGYLIPQNNPDRYFSYHPTTKELLESSSPVCFM